MDENVSECNEVKYTFISTLNTVLIFPRNIVIGEAPQVSL